MKIDVHVRVVKSSAIYGLRTAVLRPHFPPGKLAIFEGDEDDTTRHYAAYIGTGDEPVGCATLMQRDCPNYVASGEVTAMFQLRGMAVSGDHRRKGIGQHVIASIEQDLLQVRHAVLLWFNARKSAVAFYESAGYAMLGEEFDVPGIGPHYVMCKVIEG